MKKQLRPICIALSFLLTAAQLTLSASAESESPIEDLLKVVDSETDTSTELPDIDDDILLETAKKFGSETDYFTFVNFAYMANDDISNPYYVDFLRKATNAEMFIKPESRRPENQFRGILYDGHCYGISVLEILNHNGYITPSDLQEGAEKLTDVKLEGKVKDIVSHYQASQCYTLFDTYFKWNSRTFSDEQRVQQLLSIAEKAADEGKYFLIILDSKSITNPNSNKRYSHAVTGIGTADGDWEFNGEHYDKCILTFDSNMIRKDSLPDLVAWGFTPELSIFINTQTYQTYIPGYDLGKSMELNLFTHDDETLMNHLGILNPSESVNTDVSGINRIDILSDGDCSINVLDQNGETYDGINSSYKKEQEAISKSYYCKGKKFTVSNMGTDLNVNFSDIERTFMVKATENAQDVIADANNLTVTTKGSDTNYDVTLIQNNPDLPYFFYRFVGETASDIKITKAPEGIILNGTNGVQCLYDFMKPEYDSNGILINDYNFKSYSNDVGITATGSVMLKYDSDLDIFTPYLDIDKDGSYESEVQKGDVNCDGEINISDATSILSCYANNAAGNTSYANMNLGDFNNDGVINISDATDVLTFYASNAVKTKNN